MRMGYAFSIMIVLQGSHRLLHISYHLVVAERIVCAGNGGDNLTSEEQLDTIVAGSNLCAACFI